MKLHELQAPSGSRRPPRRVGRGISGRRGKTAGRGMKGQRARDQVPAGFEGGQLPLTQRIPKLRGFKNPFRIQYTPVNLDALEALGLDEVGPEELVAGGAARPGALIKILGRGTLTRAVRVRAHGFSAGAEAAIRSAGGTVERLALPYGHGRPPASGNALMNR